MFVPQLLLHSATAPMDGWGTEEMMGSYHTLNSSPFAWRRLSYHWLEKLSQLTNPCPSSPLTSGPLMGISGLINKGAACPPPGGGVAFRPQKNTLHELLTQIFAPRCLADWSGASPTPVGPLPEASSAGPCLEVGCSPPPPQAQGAAPFLRGLAYGELIGCWLGKAAGGQLSHSLSTNDTKS